MSQKILNEIEHLPFESKPLLGSHSILAWDHFFHPFILESSCSQTHILLSQSSFNAVLLETSPSPPSVAPSPLGRVVHLKMSLLWHKITDSPMNSNLNCFLFFVFVCGGVCWGSRMPGKYSTTEPYFQPQKQTS